MGCGAAEEANGAKMTELSEATAREDGHYWVYVNGRWQVAFWEERHDRWFFIGVSYTCKTDSLDEIDERLIERSA